MAKKSDKLCGNCGGQKIKSHPTTYPITVGEKQLAIERVWVRECLDCNIMKPTKAGQEKIDRGMSAFMMLMFRRFKPYLSSRYPPHPQPFSPTG